MRPGDEVLVLPARKLVRIESLPSREGDLEWAVPPMPVAVSLADAVDVGRGDILVDPADPPIVARRIRARVVWMSERPLTLQTVYLIKHTTQTVCAEAVKIVSRLDIETLEECPCEQLRLNEIGTVEFETHRPIFCDPYAVNRTTGCCILIDPATNLTLGAAMIESAENGGETRRAIPAAGRRGMTVWLTGLSSSGKSTIGQALYDRLWAMGHKVEMLDGDTVRLSLGKGLGFSKEDRDENIRRIGFVAELLTRNGVVVIVSAISPYREVREEVRRQIGGVCGSVCQRAARSL